VRARTLSTLLCLALLGAACGKKPQPAAAPAPQAMAAQAEQDSAVAEASLADTVPVPKRKTIRDYKSALTERDWQNALDSIPMLSLQTADSLGTPFIPPAVLHWLIREGYSIPQYSMWKVFPSNYFDAHLFDPAVTDWVVLASKEHISRILIFRGCNPEDTLSLYPAPDRDYLEYLGEGKFGYYRRVEHYSPERILSDARRFGAPDTTFKIEHDGLDVSHAIPGGGGLYFTNGEWLHLPGECYKPPTIPMDIWEAAAREVPCLPPSAFPNLPAWAAGWLGKEGFSIIQSFGDQNPHNVLAGEFYKAGETSWAVLASKNATSQIIVFRDGFVPDTTLFSPENNLDYMQHEGDGAFVFARIIRKADPTYIGKYFVLRNTEDKPLFPLDHEGIDDITIDKYSAVFYHHAGKWWLLVENEEGD